VEIETSLDFTHIYPLAAIVKSVGGSWFWIKYLNGFNVSNIQLNFDFSETLTFGKKMKSEIRRRLQKPRVNWDYTGTALFSNDDLRGLWW